MKSFPPLAKSLLIPGCILGLICLVFLQSLSFPFITIDDPDYVTLNQHVRPGLSAQGAWWALSSFAYGNWAPVTWLSHMLDCSLYRVNSFGHHATSILLHVLTCLLFYGFLIQTTKQRSLSALAACIFAIHPLHVEPVVWISSRKDLLSGFFWMSTLYLVHSTQSLSSSRTRYGAALLCFLLGAASKSVLITLPLVLLVFFRWPLKGEPTAKSLKNIFILLPFFFFSLCFFLLTLYGQRALGALDVVEPLSPLTRIGNAGIYIVQYLFRFFVPVDLVVHYPHPLDSYQLPYQILAWGIVAGASLSVFFLRKKHPLLLWGWVMFLFPVLPYLQLTQIGFQATSDRWMYLPLAGLSLIVAALSLELSRTFKLSSNANRVLTGSLIAALTAFSWHQVTYWKSSIQLLQHAVSSTDSNSRAHYLLGKALLEQQFPEKAMKELRVALTVNPFFAEAFTTLHKTLAKNGREEELLKLLPQQAAEELSSFQQYQLARIFNSVAGSQKLRNQYIEHFGKDPKARAQEILTRILSDNPTHFPSLNELGRTFIQDKRYDQAAEVFERALNINPLHLDVRANLGRVEILRKNYDQARIHLAYAFARETNGLSAGLALASLARAEGQLEEAEGILQKLSSVYTDSVELLSSYGLTLIRQGQRDKAILYLRKAIVTDPTHEEALNTLGAALFSAKRYREAEEILQRTVEHHPENTTARFNLAATYLNQRKLLEAKTQLEMVVQKNPSHAQAEELLRRTEQALITPKSIQ